MSLFQFAFPVMTGLTDDIFVVNNLTVVVTCSSSFEKPGLREHASVLVVGPERKGDRILSPESTMVEVNDIIWIVCHKEKLDGFLRHEVTKNPCISPLCIGQ